VAHRPQANQALPASTGSEAPERGAHGLTYYICLIRFRQRDRYTLWYADERDGLVLREGKIPLFGCEEQLEQFAAEQGILYEDEEPAPHDFDLAARWVQRGDRHSVDCPVFNAVFNLCTDAAHSLGQPGSWERAEFDPIYDKLFWGCNLPAITPPGEHYVPTWSPEEIAILREALRQALDQFLAGVDLVPDR
jgi:hypothetical protein